MRAPIDSIMSIISTLLLSKIQSKIQRRLFVNTDKIQFIMIIISITLFSLSNTASYQKLLTFVGANEHDGNQ